MIAYSSDVDNELHVALVRGDLQQCGRGSIGRHLPLVRVHSHCLTGDVFGATACDCREIVDRSLEAIAETHAGSSCICTIPGAGFKSTRRSAGGRDAAADSLPHAWAAR